MDKFFQILLHAWLSLSVNSHTNHVLPKKSNRYCARSPFEHIMFNMSSEIFLGIMDYIKDPIETFKVIQTLHITSHFMHERLQSHNFQKYVESLYPKLYTSLHSKGCFNKGKTVFHCALRKHNATVLLCLCNTNFQNYLKKKQNISSNLKEDILDITALPVQKLRYIHTLKVFFPRSI